MSLVCNFHCWRATYNSAGGGGGGGGADLFVTKITLVPANVAHTLRPVSDGK